MIPLIPHHEPETLYVRVNGDQFFIDLVEKFYEGIQADKIIRAMYPEDLEPGKQHLVGFLIQYWGGPTTYSEHRGHPRLRMRHAPFIIDLDARDRWMKHMTAAVEASSATPDQRLELLAYFDNTATFLINHNP